MTWTDPMNVFHSRYRNYLFLIPLLAVAIAYQIAYTVTAVRDRLDTQTVAQEPLPLDSADQVAFTTAQARKAGLHRGERILSVNGVPVSNAESEAAILRGKKPGDSVEVVAQNGASGLPTRYSFVLEPYEPDNIPATAWALTGLLLAMSLLSIGVGTYVALRLPNDISAVSLFGVLAGMLQFVHISSTWQWPAWAHLGAIIYSTLLQGTWPVWMMLFGINFPERSRFDVDRPWLKWLLIVPLLAFSVFEALTAATAEVAFSMSAPMQLRADAFSYLTIALSMAAATLFFACLGSKIRSASSRDAKRRLLILWAGSTLSLTPMFLLFLYVVIFRKGDPSSPPQAVIVPVVLLLCGFPVTLAYAVLAQRALELRVAIRLGLRYAFAKAGLQLFGWTVTAAFIWAVSEKVFSVHTSRPLQVAVDVGLIVVAVTIIRRVRKRASLWVDRRFFRESYNAELILTDLNESIRTIIDETRLLDTVARAVADSLHVPCVAIWLNTNGTLKPTYTIGCETIETVSLSESAYAVEQTRTAKDPLQIFFDVPGNWIFQAPPAERAALLCFHTQLLLPIMVRDRLLGLLSLSPKKSEELYSKTDISLLRSVLFQTGLALENSRLASKVASEMAERGKLNREIEIAREVQERLFPQDLPLLPGLDYWGSCRPALGVGGDYYDFIPLAGGDIGIAIGDVSGKGIAAALLMASLQASLRGQALQGSKDLTKVISNVNRLVFDASPVNRYATFFYAQFERSSRRLTYVNAGHNPPIILRKTSGITHVIRLDTGGTVIGLFRDAPYQQASLALEKGDVLIGFTDGISEAMNLSDEEWGEERMLPALEACAGRSAREMIPAVMKAADLFVDGAPQHDDMTLVVMKLDAAA